MVIPRIDTYLADVGRHRHVMPLYALEMILKKTIYDAMSVRANQEKKKTMKIAENVVIARVSR
jgi:hypothetical protein